MADTDIPDNIDLRFIAIQQARILSELAEMRAGLSDLAELRIGQAALSTDLKAVKESVDDLGERMSVAGLRLNTIDARLARIEKHTGLVKA
jgi:hypothetical protein